MKNNLKQMLPADQNDYRIHHTPSPAAKRCFFHVLETGYLKLEPEQRMRRQSRTSFLFVVVLSGSGVLQYGNESYHVSKGECFFLDARLQYACQNTGEQPWNLMWVHFHGATSEEYYRLFRAEHDVVFAPASTIKFTALLRELINLAEQDTDASEILTSNLLSQLLTQLLTLNAPGSATDNALRTKLKAVLSYLDDHYTTDLSLDALSQQFYISKYYLTREFKRAYGETIFQHIIATRIHHAKRLLRFTDKSVDEISELCGFHDQSYFTKQFKKAENMTCLAYRKRWRS